MDVAVVHPLAPSAPVCGVKDGSEAIAGMERVKFAKYADAYRESNIRFLPFVLSTFGKLGGEGGTNRLNRSESPKSLFAPSPPRRTPLHLRFRN